MRSRLFRVGALAVGLCSLLVFGVAAGGSSNAKVTFTKDVAPILYNRCVECHRAGEVAPMALITYNETRPWAKAIKQKVVDRSMPPWLASPENTHFKNERRLSQNEINTIAAWVDAGAPKGTDEDLPAPPKFEQGWAIGKPDAVISLDQAIAVPAEGVIPYKYLTVQTNFNEDKWVQAAEIRAGNRKVVHHIIVFVQEPGANNEQGRGGRGVKLCGFAPGEQPTGPLVQSEDGVLFGTTARVGDASAGASFSIDRSGRFRVHHVFAGGSTPIGGLILAADGHFYGTTTAGVFRFTPPETVTPLYSFGNYPAGGGPLAGLTEASDAHLYGVAGGPGNAGSVFRIDAKGRVVVLHAFATDGSEGSGRM